MSDTTTTAPEKFKVMWNRQNGSMWTARMDNTTGAELSHHTGSALSAYDSIARQNLVRYSNWVIEYGPVRSVIVSSKASA